MDVSVHPAGLPRPSQLHRAQQAKGPSALPTWLRLPLPAQFTTEQKQVFEFPSFSGPKSSAAGRLCRSQGE